MDELRNLQQMASLASGRFNQYDGEDFVLPQIFKEQVTEINSNTITYNKYSAIIETRGNQHGILNIFMPNQWFYIASYFTDFYNELQKYKRYALQVTSKERLKELNGGELTATELSALHRLTLDDKSMGYLLRFITDYSWWGGAKTIDRGDFYVSPILSNANLVNASQSFVADLCAFLADKQNLVRAIINKEESGSPINARTLLFQPCIESKEGINGFLDRAIPIVLERDADLYRLDKFTNVDGGVYLTIGKHNLGRATDKDARPNDINPNIEWTCGLNGKRYYLNREVNYPNFVTFQEAFNEAYRGIFEIIIDTIDYNGTQRKRYSLYALNSAKPFTPNQPLQSTKYIDIITAAKTKPFILLAGISGTGKSRIVRELARACWDEGSEEYKAQKPQNFEMIQVKPNWHDSTELLGYVSRVSGKPVYVVGDFLRFITKAWENIDVPHFLCLDEMNLAPVEQYFAEYLSVVESRKLIGGKVVTDAILKKCSEQWFFDLTAQLTEDEELRSQFNNEGIALPPNLIVVGTVNMDETTFSFSRKVLDRAMTIEMNEVDLWGGLDSKYERIGKLSGDMLIGKAVEGVDVYADNKEVCDIALGYLKSVNEILDKTPFKVAYRTRNEFLLYVVNNLPYTIGEDGTEYSRENVIATALDEITSMKVLSRIEGDDTKVPKTLLTGLKHCIETQLLQITGDDDKIESVSIAKLDEMLNRLESGYTSFWS